MHHTTPLPDFLLERYRTWRSTTFPANRARYADLAANGQAPAAMIITCCDSRVLASEVFGAETGDFFVHRNIAALVPPYHPDAVYRATSATVEYAVTTLRVAHVIVMGHYGCGGVQGCHDMLSGLAPELCAPSSFVGSWLRILEPAYHALAGLDLDRAGRIAALEKQAILISLHNLMTFPFVAEAVARERLQIHGVWKDIRDGGIEVFDAATQRFIRC